MKLETVKSEGLAHNSYLLIDGTEAAVVDPRRDAQIYVELASQACAKIKYIFETHRNEDYVVGSLELQALTDAEISHSNALPFKYGEHNLVDGDELSVGNTKIKVLYTPGHTNESLCYLIYPAHSSEPKLLFSGDTLFAGSVGRTDLYGKEAQQVQAEKLYNSLHDMLLWLDGSVLVYPAHGAGSVCGHGINGLEPTTIGYEKKTNPYLHLDKDAFIKKAVSDQFVVPAYFKTMEKYNLEGPPLLSKLAYPKAFIIPEFEEHLQNSAVTVMDTREPYAFAGAHIPDAVSMWLDGASVYTGWVLDPKQHLVTVHERAEDIDTATARLRRLGFDNICGHLCGGMNGWQEAGKPIRNIPTMSVMELKERLEQVAVLDVREPSEWNDDSYIEGAKRIVFSELPQHADPAPKKGPVAVICSAGNRSSIACSLLLRTGYRNIINVLGGMTAWVNRGYPTKKET